VAFFSEEGEKRDQKAGLRCKRRRGKKKGGASHSLDFLCKGWTRRREKRDPHVGGRGGSTGAPFPQPTPEHTPRKGGGEGKGV